MRQDAKLHRGDTETTETARRERKKTVIFAGLAEEFSFMERAEVFRQLPDGTEERRIPRTDSEVVFSVPVSARLRVSAVKMQFGPKHKVH